MSETAVTNVKHVSSIFYGSVAYGTIPLGCIILGWMSFATFCGVNSCMLWPIRCFTYCSKFRHQACPLESTVVRCRDAIRACPVEFSQFLCCRLDHLFTDRDQCDASSRRQAQHFSKRLQTPVSVNAVQRSTHPCQSRLIHAYRMILLGTKWRAERNFYMALVNW